MWGVPQNQLTGLECLLGQRWPPGLMFNTPGLEQLPVKTASHVKLMPEALELSATRV